MKKDQKKQVIQQHQTHKKDTGSPQVQVAILTEEILNLTEHMKTHRKDKHSQQGLLKKVGRRAKLLKYLKLNDMDVYKHLVSALGLRK